MKTTWDQKVPSKSFYFKTEAVGYCNKMNYIISHYLKYSKNKLNELMDDWHKKNQYQLNIPYFGDPRHDDVNSFIDEEKFYLKLVEDAKIKYLSDTFKYSKDEIETILEVSSEDFRPFFSIVEVEIE